MSRGARAEPAPPECALAAEMFDHLCSAGTMKQTLALHREICAALNLRPNRLPDFYPKLKAKLVGSWKAQALFKKFDARSNHKVYAKGRACTSTRVLIIGAGPCGLRAAIECQLLGAKVVVVEKRDRMSRNNVLHLWPFVIQDLKALGAKKFFGKFCAGSIDHISIRQLQCILLKVALFLGVEFHEGVSFEELLEPTVTENSETLGWRARVQPPDHPVSLYEFDTLLGADGRRNTLPGFKRKEFRGKLAMAITANFINRHTEQEASVPEISGVAFIFNQKFFKDLYEETGIDLENIVYYKDDTHYFVMTAKKHSLLDKGVLLNDYNEVSRLLHVENVDRAALMRYAQEAARFSTGARLPLRDFALNHYGEPDVALFDFTSMYAAENASMVYERLGRRLLCQLVGDSLLEPFWPTGSGCARGFLSALDAAWAVRAWGQGPPPHPLHVVAERESVYRLLAQTTPENLNRDFGGYTLDPGTRYPNLNRAAVSPHRVTGFYDSDDPLPLDAGARKRRREAEVPEEVLLSWLGVQVGGLRDAAAAPALAALLRRYRPDLLTDAPDSVYSVLQHEFGIPVLSTGNLREVPEAKLRVYLTRVYSAFKGEVPHVHHQSDVFLQIKQSQQKEKQARNTADHSLAMYSNAVDADKSHSSYRKKRRAVRTPQVSIDDDYIRRKIGKLDLNDITHLARLIEGHDLAARDNTDKQQALQEEILALLDPEEAPDPIMLRESLAQLLQGTTTKPKHEHKPRVKRSVPVEAAPNLDSFFQDTQAKPVRPPRRLKGLDLNSMKYPDLTQILGDEANDTDATLVQAELPKKKVFTRTSSTEAPPQLKERRPSEIIDAQKRRSQSPLPKLPYGRSHSIGSPEAAHSTRRIAEMFESQKRRHTPSPDARVGSASTSERALRWQRMTELIEGKPAPFVNTDKAIESIGNPEMAFRRQRVSELIQGPKPERGLSSDPAPKRKNAEDMSFRMQRASDQVQRGKSCDTKKRTGGRRKAAREIMRQRFEKSLQMLAAEPQMTLSSSADLEHDVGLQQYRANAPQFGDRVKKLEKQLQHYEEGRVVTGGGRAGGGARVARLAAELAGSAAPAAPRASKPKDLMRSVGKIERDDWNVKEIEKKIMQNRLGRPEPKTAEKVPKWDREQFLGRQRRLKEGENEEKWGVIDETLHKLDQKLRDSGRPDHGTKKVANLANKFVKKETEPEKAVVAPKEDKKSWRGPSTAGMQCAACGTRVFAAESVTADGLHLHRACFRCTVCKAVLRPGNYTMERYGSRLVCLRHSGVSVPDAAALAALGGAPTPERISLEASDSGAREIDEDEWTDRNFLASETSGAGGLSSEEESSSEELTDAEGSAEEPVAPPAAEAGARPRTHLYLSDDSFGYDDYSDDGGESSGNESCSRMREAREARRREVPADARPPTDSSEVESEDESEESEESEPSSGTEVSTDSEFAREEPVAPPAILVTEAPPPLPPPPPPPVPLARARSAGGLATKRALELKRKYLLGEPSPPAVRKSDSTSQLDTKLQAFRTNITEFQKMLHPAPTPPTPTVAAFQVTTAVAKKPMPDIIKNLCDDAPVDLLKLDCKKEWREETIAEEKSQAPDTDSLSESSHTETGPEQPVPRLEVHDEGGELIQLDSLMIIPEPKEDHKEAPPVETPAPAPLESESSDSCRDATTLALTETELSDWAAESAVLDDFDDNKDDRKRSKNPRSLSGPKTVHDAKNLSTISSHVCGKTSPPQSIMYSNALEHFEFADEGDQDPSIGSPVTPKNQGYMELVDEDYDVYSPVNDRSMNFIERSFSETLFRPSLDTEPSSITPVPPADTKSSNLDDLTRSTDSESTITRLERPIVPELKSPQLLVTIESSESDKSISKPTSPIAEKCPTTSTIGSPITTLSSTKSTFSSLKSPTSSSKSATSSSTDTKEQLSLNSPSLIKEVDTKVKVEPPLSITIRKDFASVISPPLADTPVRTTFAAATPFKMYSPAICRSASASFSRPLSPEATTVDKVQELKREREEQTDIVRKLVLERLGRAPRRSARRCRASPVASAPPPIPPPPAELPPPTELPPAPALPPPAELPPPPRPAPPLPVTPSLSDPELARDRRSKSIIRSLSSYFNRRLGPRTKWVSEPDLSPHEAPRLSRGAHKSTGALELPPPVPPPPARYRPPDAPPPPSTAPGGANDADERDAMQLWFEARWARLVAARRARDDVPRSEPAARRLARLERRLARPLSAEQQAAAVAELVQVSAARGAHQALLAADNRRRSTASGSCD